MIIKLSLITLMAIILTGCGNKTYRCFDKLDSEVSMFEGLYEELVELGKDLEKILKDAKKSNKNNSASNYAVITQALSAVNGTIWNTKTIPVCWEAHSFRLEDQDKRDLVKMAVENTWEDALYLDIENNVKFTGWNICDDSNDYGIRIEVADIGPHVDSIGTGISGQVNGMTLNFDFALWSPVCKDVVGNEEVNRDCIYSIAVHEFGHALGIAHEHNRSDTDHLTCPESQMQGTIGDINLGPWDPDSVMNYCNRYWNNNGLLSSNDYYGIRKLYFPNKSGVYCVTQKKFDEKIQEYRDK